MIGARLAMPILICAAALLSATGCAGPSAPNRPAPEGQLAVMGPDPSFSLDAPPKDWIISTTSPNPSGQGRATLRTVSHQGVPAVELSSTDTMSVAVRRVDAMLLATPYLSWSWHLSDHGQGIHPVRIVVGFVGGIGEDAARDPLGGDLPAHDRAIALVWGDTLLRRGSLSLPPADRPTQAPLYTVRGGRENTRRWWLETVDLSQIYAEAWPGDDFKKVRIGFIGLAAAPRKPAVSGRVSGILLSH